MARKWSGSALPLFTRHRELRRATSLDGKSGRLFPGLDRSFTRRLYESEQFLSRKFIPAGRRGQSCGGCQPSETLRESNEWERRLPALEVARRPGVLNEYQIFPWVARAINTYGLLAGGRHSHSLDIAGGDGATGFAICIARFELVRRLI